MIDDFYPYDPSDVFILECPVCGSTSIVSDDLDGENEFPICRCADCDIEDLFEVFVVYVES